MTFILEKTFSCLTGAIGLCVHMKQYEPEPEDFFSDGVPLVSRKGVTTSQRTRFCDIKTLQYLLLRWLLPREHQRVVVTMSLADEVVGEVASTTLKSFLFVSILVPDGNDR